MIDVKAIVGGVAVAGSLALAPLGMGVANAAPPPVAPPVPSVQGTSQADVPAPAPSPYASYGNASVCAMPGLYFVNICV
ncbi:hypothetical protein [Mycolicibacterium sp.]|uniref:hypothetical protein n=1 Tax=Mycolicibacterium sp. TaxID=2320850 RepID=UPI001A2C04EE|nr:hypothetical protein [Mycolicibacterium sp.]MBJ7336684.1 hypothetical protein [Mycolicibacterium sp.]